VWGHAAGTGLPALRGSTRWARADPDDAEEPDANAGKRRIEAMCTLPVAGAIEASSALTGPLLHRPAATTSTPATVALVRKALVARRRGVVELGVPIDLMFLRHLPGGPANDLVDSDCQYSRRYSHIGGLLGRAERYRTTLCEHESPGQRSPPSGAIANVLLL
jgi:hypothetical protein